MTRLDEIKARLEAATRSAHPNHGVGEQAWCRAIESLKYCAPGDIAYLVAEVERLRQIVRGVHELKERLSNSESDETYELYRELCDMDLREEA